jgi:flagellar basal-body rod protein FlgB
MKIGVFDPLFDAINANLNARTANQNIITSNIANADTPGYKAKALDFESEFREALDVDNNLRLEGSDPDHFTKIDPIRIEPRVYDDPNGIESIDGNTVDRSAQMSNMIQNQILYDAAVQVMKKRLGMLSYSVTEGGGNR